ncbi:MAG: translation initiation factor IF-2 subunit gamma [Candidatus Marsarchaeota archaeon]|nr:translation initiation factor IF-2 subunit gamma [Candidatus Marsarchaeota archaeon]
MQSKINIMTAGHVDHGKTTLVQAITGNKISTHSEELKRGITIKLGYSDCVFYKDGEKYNSKTGEEVMRVSFLDAPGHETLMATVIAASSIVDGAILVIAANEKCPQPQTAEHLAVIEAAEIKQLIIVQNKIDLVDEKQAGQNYEEIKNFLKGTSYENALIIPVSANLGLNINYLIQAIVENFKPVKKDEGEAVFYVARSFDVNKPRTKIDEIKGAVLGGSVVKGVLKVGDEIEILPGVAMKKKDKEYYQPLETKIVEIEAGKEKVDEAKPGGLIGISTLLDPSISKSDSLVGCVVGRKGTLSRPINEVKMILKPIKRSLISFPPFTSQEPIVLGIGTATTLGFIKSQKKSEFILELKKPVCVFPNQKISIMRRAQNRWHLYATAVSK